MDFCQVSYRCGLLKVGKYVSGIMPYEAQRMFLNSRVVEDSLVSLSNLFQSFRVLE